jgi:hypothetical protein
MCRCRDKIREAGAGTVFGSDVMIVVRKSVQARGDGSYCGLSGWMDGPG